MMEARVGVVKGDMLFHSSPVLSKMTLPGVRARVQSRA